MPQCTPKPEGDTYKFTHFAHKLMAGKGLNPLLSDSRRRKDRLALQVSLNCNVSAPIASCGDLLMTLINALTLCCHVLSPRQHRCSVLCWTLLSADVPATVCS